MIIRVTPLLLSSTLCIFLIIVFSSNVIFAQKVFSKQTVLGHAILFSIIESDTNDVSENYILKFKKDIASDLFTPCPVEIKTHGHYYLINSISQSEIIFVSKKDTISLSSYFNEIRSPIAYIKVYKNANKKIQYYSDIIFPIPDIKEIRKSIDNKDDMIVVMAGLYHPNKNNNFLEKILSTCKRIKHKKKIYYL